MHKDSLLYGQNFFKMPLCDIAGFNNFESNFMRLSTKANEIDLILIHALKNAVYPDCFSIHYNFSILQLSDTA